MVVLGVFPVNMLELINIHSGKSYEPTSAQGRQRVLQIDLGKAPKLSKYLKVKKEGWCRS